MSRRTKGLGIAAIILILAVAGWFALGGYKKNEATVLLAGIIEGPEVNIAPKVSGKIAEMYCKEGDPVKAGQVVFRLESNDLKAAVDEATAVVERSRANIRVSESAIRYARTVVDAAVSDIGMAQAEAEKVRAKMNDAGAKLARVKALYKQRLISEDEFETAATADASAAADLSSAQAKIVGVQSKKEAALAQLDSAENQLLLAKSDLKQSEANLSYALTKLSDTTVVSPTSGTVVFKALEKGEMVSPGVTVLTVVDLSNLYARADVDERWVEKIPLGSEATLRTEGSPNRPFKGKVSEVGRYAEFATQRDMTRGRQDIKTFRVKVSFQDPSGFLKPGMTVDVEIAKQP
jgi:HlyD family secretion protein